MSKVFATIHGRKLTQEEDETLNLWKYLQIYSREIVDSAIAMVEAEDGFARLSAQMRLEAATKNYIRLGGKLHA